MRRWAARSRADAQIQFNSRGDAEALSPSRREAMRWETEPRLSSRLRRAEKWNGVLPTTMVPGGAVPFVSGQMRGLQRPARS